MPRRVPARVSLRPHAALDVLPPLTEAEVDLLRENVRENGQSGPVEVIDTGEVVVGWDLHKACIAEGVKPRITTIETPPCIIEYVLRRNVPRRLNALDRACIAVLAKEQFQAEAKKRKSLARRGRKDRERSARSSFTPERWWQQAARVVGCSPNAVKDMAMFHSQAPDVFAAFRSRRLRQTTDGRYLTKKLDNPQDRAEAIQRWEAGRGRISMRKVVDRMVMEMAAERRAPSRGERWIVHHGRLEQVGRRVDDESVHVVHADIEYGKVEMAAAVVQLTSRVLVPGGVLLLIAGQNNIPKIMETAAAHLDYVATGGIVIDRAIGSGIPDRVHRVDLTPVLVFAKQGQLVRRLNHLAFIADRQPKEAVSHPWQKPLDATVDLLRSVADPHPWTA